MMDPLHFCIAAVPLAVYLFLIGVLNLRRRPLVIAGTRDCAAVGIAAAGLMIIGPMELFMPQAAATQYGPWVWLMMLAFYGLMVSLVVLLMRARIVIYNITPEQLRPILTKIAMQFDSSSRWTGDNLMIPNRTIHLHVESSMWCQNVQLVASGNVQSYDGWRQLEEQLRSSVQETNAKPNLIGIPFLISALGLMTLSLAWMLSDKDSVVAAFREMTSF